jgi:hypothetical protein
LSWFESARWQRVIASEVAKFLKALVEQIPAVPDVPAGIPDAAFLAKLGTEIMVFRPCGHAICATPCFRDLAKTARISPLAKPRWRTAAWSMS